jgi:hypothetical protein
VDLNKNFAELNDADLAAYAATVRQAFTAIADMEAPTEAQVSEAESYADHLDAISALQAQRVEAAQKLAARRNALRSRFAVEEPEAEPVEEAAEEDGEPEEEEPAPAVEEVPAAPTTSSSATGVVALARKVARPAKPAASRAPVVITAAADVPDFATGSRILGLEEVGKATVNRMRGFGVPSGDGTSEDLRHVGVASFKLDFPKELTIDRHSDDLEVLTYAGKESRLPGKSLVASGGWCAPSETIYDLCAGETTDGILSVPEVNVSRGGIKYTSGPDFSSIYTNVGFCQTEAQAIAGNTKTCFEVPCPAFTEVRLDACGLCIKAPILTQAAYPELVQRWISGSMIAHQHKMNNKVLTAMATAAGTAKVITGIGTTAGDTLGGLELIADGLRQKYKLGLTQTLEVVVPFWVRGAIRSDLGNRTGQPTDAVTDADITAHFSARHLAVSFVYDWQELATPPAVAYPATFQALVYPAGTFIKGTSDIITLNAVYDAASLAVNTYTALFFEQGILVAKMCYEATLVTLPICNAGRTGAANFTCP